MMRPKLPLLFAAIPVIALSFAGGPALADEPMDAATCAVCHEDGVKEFTTSDHGRAMARPWSLVVNSFTPSSWQTAHVAASMGSSARAGPPANDSAITGIAANRRGSFGRIIGIPT